MHWNHAEFIPNHPSYIEFPSRMLRGPCLWRTVYWTRILTSPISRQAKPPQISPTIFQTHIREGTIALTVEAARHFSNAHRVEERPSLPEPNISFSPQRGFYKSSQHTKNKGASARNKFRSYEVFGVYQKDMPSVTNKLTARIPREEGREEGRKDEGKKKERRKELAGYTGRDGFALSVYDLFRCSRRDCHCVCITPGLSRVIGAFGPGVCTLAVCRTRD